MSEEEKTRLVDNIIDSMKPVKPEIQRRQIYHFYKTAPDYGIRVDQGLGIDIEKEVLSK